MPILREIRVHQWIKNILIFVPALTAHRMGDPRVLGNAFVAFLSFSLCASAVYMFNDLHDLAADRSHPEKRNRPLASGQISVGVAYALAAVLAACGLGLGAPLGGPFLLSIGTYLLANAAYSVVVKKLALLDVLLLASLYTIRIFAGSAATSIPVSEWLLAFSMFTFLSLALLKRFTELQRFGPADGEPLGRRGYVRADVDYIPVMGISSGFVMTLVMALYVSSDRVRSLYERPSFLWFLCPLLLYWISRFWLLGHRGKLAGDPVVFALKDPISWGVAACALGIMALAV